MVDEEKARFQVPLEHAGSRLDWVVRKRRPELSRRVLEELFQCGEVRVNQRVAKKGEPVRAGDWVELSLPPADRAHANPELPLCIASESPHWVVVDKPAGMPSVARDGRDPRSLASALVARYPAMAGLGHHAREAGLVHRLDTNTSGLLLAAKSESSFGELTRALREGRLEKRYLAIALDVRHESARVSGELAPGPSGKVLARRVVQSSSSGGRKAQPRVTDYRVLDRNGRLALLELDVSAAYRHQIRAHLAAVGSPILGDSLYGGPGRLGRHALHASRLAYPGRSNLAAFAVDSALPEELVRAFARGWEGG